MQGILIFITKVWLGRVYLQLQGHIVQINLICTIVVPNHVFYDLKTNKELP